MNNQSRIYKFQMIRLGEFGVSIANKNYNTLNGDYEIIVLNHSSLDVMHDESVAAARPSFQFRSVHEFETLPIDGLYGIFDSGKR